VEQNNINELTWAELGELLEMNKDVVRMRANRSGKTKEQIYEQIKSEQEKPEQPKTEQKQQQRNMRRTMTRSPFTVRKYGDINATVQPIETEQRAESLTSIEQNVHPEQVLVEKSEQKELNRNEQIRQRIDEWMIENTGKITAVLKSNFLSVVVMLTLSIVVATVFTSRVALAVGVQPFFAYSIAVLVDVSAIIFMFRGKKWLSWVFGLNIFLQIALTSESTLARLWFSQETILGLKVALLATAVLTAIEGFSSLSSQNKD
jgi:hypothetical protein